MWSRKTSVLVPIAIIVAAVVAFGGWAAWNLRIGPYFEDGCVPGCAGFAWSGAVEVLAPSAAGCQAIAGDLCYETGFISPVPGKSMSDLPFYGTNESMPYGPPIRLGPNATVTVLGPGNRTVAVWQVSGDEWVYGGGEVVPRNVAIDAALDTGLTSNDTLVNTYLMGQLDGGEGTSGVLLLPFGS
jgi:hypothetical protein